MENGTISIDFVHEALACIRDRGVDQVPLLIQAGISPDLLHLPLSRVSSSQFGMLWHLIAKTLDDEFFGMDSHPMKSGSFTLLCHAVIGADTLERALRRALRFFRVVLDDIAGELRRDGATARIVLSDLPSPGQPKRAFAYGTLLIMLHGLACWLIGRRIPLQEACFRCPEPSFSQEWRILFSRTLRFEQPHSGIAFPAEYLDMETVQGERSMKEFLRSAPANFLVKYKNSATLSAKIRRHLRDLPPADWPDFATVARQFKTSAATLRRRLDDEGQSYRSITDDLRHDLAIALLSDTDHSVIDIALQLGFAEPSAFYRAFRKWTGGRPGEYRINAGPRVLQL